MPAPFPVCTFMSRSSTTAPVDGTFSEVQEMERLLPRATLARDSVTVIEGGTPVVPLTEIVAVLGVVLHETFEGQEGVNVAVYVPDDV